MRFHLFALFLVVVMLRARADSGLVFRASGDEATPGLEYNSFMGQQATNTSVGQEQEDRDLFGFDKVAKVLVPRFKQLQGLPRIDESVKDAFETLGLNSMPISRDEIIREHLVTKFFSCREFNRWAKHVARTNKQDRYAAMIHGGHKLGEKLEMAQFEWWFSRGYGSDYILMSIFDIRQQYLPHHSRLDSIHRRYSDFFDAKGNFPGPEETVGSAYEKMLAVEYFSSRKFKRWTNHVTMKNKKDRYAAMFEVLVKVHGKKKVAKILALANDSQRTRSIGTKLEKTQFRWWVRKGYQPDDIPKKVFRLMVEDMPNNPWLQRLNKRYSKFTKKQTTAPIPVLVIKRPSSEREEKLRSP
uniref:RxLR effector candidate protein n=1 Tax=Hyaloperonospora arabidopsidis (strain Emoy2) TaxID=559515 RepID=A0A090BGV1_HYAAE|nr:RxLR effector candidate protein [Hyaloperonospora arabidopsidis Emoy2]